MKLLDTNILIYAAEAQYSSLLLPLVTDSANLVSPVDFLGIPGLIVLNPLPED